MNKRLLSFIIATSIIFLFTSCASTDIVGNAAIQSFKLVLDAIPDKVTKAEEVTGWSLTAPDDSAEFIFKNDYSAEMIFDAKPFIDAGLDVSKFPIDIVDDKIIIKSTKYTSKNPEYNWGETPISYFETIVKFKRDHIKYHGDLDHFGVSLDNGNMFEFAKDMSKNDKDIVFALNPQVFIDAGVDPNKVEGWVFAKVKTMESNGKTIEVDKFLKPFNLK